MDNKIICIKRSANISLCKAYICNNWILFKIVKKKYVYMRLDDSFAKANGYASLKDMQDRDLDFKAQYDKAVKDKDGYLWALYENGEWFGMNKTKLN